MQYNNFVRIFGLVFTLLVLTFSAHAQITQEERGNVTFTREGPFNTGDLKNVGRELGVDVLSVEVDDVLVETGDTIRLNVEREDALDIRVVVEAREANQDVEIEASIRGDDNFQIVDTTNVFRVEPETRYVKTLELELPDIIEEDTYSLRVCVFDRSSAVKCFNYFLSVEPMRHRVIIRDVTFSPENEVVPGRAVLVVARVRNLGQREEDNIRVHVAIPALGVSATDYIDELGPEDSISGEEMFLRIPPDARPGTYPVFVTVEYDEGFKRTTEEFAINVIGSPMGFPGEPGFPGQQPPVEVPTPERTVINVGTQSQDAARGEGGAIFPITIQNEGRSSKSYTVGVTGATEFGTVKISPSNLVMVDGGETKQVFVFVAAREGSALGQHLFNVEIKAGDEVLEQIPLTLNVVEPERRAAAGFGAVAKVLLIILIVLIVAGLIFSSVVYYKRTRTETEEEPEIAAQTYY